MKKSKVLFIHHGRILGGAPVSLLNTVKGLEQLGQTDNKILFAHDDMKPFFRDNCNAQIGDLFDPCLILGRVFIGYAAIGLSTLHLVLKDFLILPLSIFRQYRLLKKESPDIVHLNSSILFTSAIAAKLAGIKLVWHIREILAIREVPFLKKSYAKLIRKLADVVIPISNAEAEGIGTTDQDKNVRVIFNFLDFKKFDYLKVEKHCAREKLGINKKMERKLYDMKDRRGAN